MVAIGKGGMLQRGIRELSAAMETLCILTVMLNTYVKLFVKLFLLYTCYVESISQASWFKKKKKKEKIVARILKIKFHLKKFRFLASLEKLEDMASLSPHFLLATMAGTEQLLPISDGYLPSFWPQESPFIPASFIINYINQKNQKFSSLPLFKRWYDWH